MTGQLIILNGASSSGKSTIARALQDMLDEPFWHYSIDHLRDAGVLPLARFRRGDFAWSAHRSAFFEGFHRSLPALAGAGNNLIVEHIVETPEWMRLLAELLRGFDVFFVGVHCPLEELERRELARGDRPVGDTRRDFATIPRHATYDLELAARRPAEDNARSLLRAWRERSDAGAFGRLINQPVPIDLNSR